MEAVADMDYTVADNELEARYERYKGVLKNLTLMSDVTAAESRKEKSFIQS